MRLPFARLSLLATLLVFANQRNLTVGGAEVLSGEDAALLHMLQPSSRSALPGWLEYHEQLSREVSEAKTAGGVDVVIYGDSIMEAFCGSSVGMPFLQQYGQNKAAYSELMGTKKSLVLGIAGDQAVHLLWRLQNGEGPQGLNPKFITIMIGTNDMAHLASLYPDDEERVAHIISLAVQQCVRELQRQAPQATIVVLGLLPLQPMMLRSPQRMFDSKIATTNKRLQVFVEQQATGKLIFKDCGGGFTDADGAVKRKLIPDGVHPAGKGASVLLSCMMEAIDG